MDTRLFVANASIDDILDSFSKFSALDKKRIITLLRHNTRLELQPLSMCLREKFYKHLIVADYKIIHFILSNYSILSLPYTNLQGVAARCIDEGWIPEFEMCHQLTGSLINFSQYIFCHCVVTEKYEIATKVYERALNVDRGRYPDSIIGSTPHTLINMQDAGGLNYLAGIHPIFLCQYSLLNRATDETYIDTVVRLMLEHYPNQLEKYISNDLVLLSVQKHNSEVYQQLISKLESDI